MKFQSLKTQSATLAISLLALCGTFTSCVEDEENPFRNDDDDEYAQLPGNGMFYIGSEVEMRGRGFLPSDQVWVRDSYTGQLLQARTTNCTGDKLFFIIPGGLTPYSNVEVSITQGDDTELIGSLYLTDYYIVNNPSPDETYAEDVSITGEISPNDRLYYQEAVQDYSSEDGYKVVGDICELNLMYDEETLVGRSVLFPLNSQYLLTFEHNGEVAKRELMGRMTNFDFYVSGKVGNTVEIEWQGFKPGDSVLIDDYSGSYITAESSVVGKKLTFTIPQLPYYNSNYGIMIKRYDNCPPTQIGTLYIEPNE